MSAASEHVHDLGARAAIRATLDMLVEPGAVHELRVLGLPRRNVASGYFDNFDALAAAAAGYDGRAEGIYFTPNPPLPELLARAMNRVREYAQATTTDDQIARRRWLLIDCDFERPKGISASEEEHAAAITRAHAIANYLGADLDWPGLVVADSGNGGHVLGRINLENTPESTALVERCLRALAALFNEDGVVVDTKVSNAARIWKLYGTLACKGDSTPERPHRRSELLYVPDPLEVVPREKLEELAAMAPADQSAGQQRQRSNGRASSFDLEAWIAEHGLDVRQARDWNGGGRRWEFSVCPFNAEHDRGEAFIVQHASGAISAGCQHQSCTWGWRELRERFEPDAYRSRGEHGAEQHEDAEEGERPAAEARDRAIAARFERVSIAYAFEGPPAARRFLLRDFAPENETGLFVALGGAGKGHAQVALARALALGEPFGGFEPPRPRGVLIVSMEEDADELHRRLWASLRLGVSDEDFRERLEGLRPTLTSRLGFVSLRGLPGVTFESVRDPLLRAAEQIEDLGLVTLDPVGRFVPAGCEINSQEGAATIISALDRLREEIQALTVGVYHVSKLAHRTGSELAAGASSGSQQLEDLARWVLNGRSLRAEDAARYGLDPGGRYLELGLAKSNYTATLGEPLVFQRGPGGALQYVRASRPEVADEEAALAALLRLGHWATREQWEEAAAESSGLPRERCRNARSRLVNGGSVQSQELRDGRRFKVVFAPRERPEAWPDPPVSLEEADV